MIGYVIISWVSADPYNPIVRFINAIADPICSFIRRYIPPIGVLDLSPLIAFFGLLFLDSFLVGSMISYGNLAVVKSGGVING
jgi:YggT family protein